MFSYLPKDARKRIKKFKYAGADNSLLYNYVLSPFAQLLIDKIFPLSFSPNLIIFCYSVLYFCYT